MLPAATAGLLLGWVTVAPVADGGTTAIAAGSLAIRAVAVRGDREALLVG